MCQKSFAASTRRSSPQPRWFARCRPGARCRRPRAEGQSLRVCREAAGYQSERGGGARRPSTSRARCVVGLNFRFAEGVVRLRRLLDDGRYGPVTHVRVSQLASKPRRSLWGEDCRSHSLFFAQGIHAIDLLHVLLSQAVLAGAARAAGGRRRGHRSLPMGRAWRPWRGGLRFLHTISHRVDITMASGVTLSLVDLSELTTATTAQDGSQCDCRVLWRRSPLSTGYGHAGYQGELDAFAKIVAGQTDDGTRHWRMQPGRFGRSTTCWRDSTSLRCEHVPDAPWRHIGRRA